MTTNLNYKSSVQELLSNDFNETQIKNLQLDKLYMFEDDETYKDVFHRFYSFGQECLNNYISAFDGCKAYLCFANVDEINAFATRVDDILIVQFNKGLVVRLYENLSKVNFKSRFAELENICKEDTRYLIIQFGITMTFLHEVGHLIQYSDSTENYQSERKVIGNSNYNLKSHISEMDADWFSAFGLANFTNNFIEINKIESENAISDVIRISLFSICYFHIVLLDGRFDPFYTDKYSHPHAFIRVVAVCSHFLDILSKRYPIKQINVMIDSLILCDKIIEAIEGQRSMATEWFRSMHVNEKQSNRYIKAMFKLMKRYPDLASQKLKGLT